MNQVQKDLRVLFILVVIIFIMILTSVFVGDYNLILNDFFNTSSTTFLILQKFRIPKILTALLSGGALGIMGCIMQTVFKNPLADPYILGVNSGASFGVVVWIMVGSFIPELPLWVQILGQSGFAAIGGILILFVLLVLLNYRSDLYSILIIGVVLGYLLSGLTGILVSLSHSDELRSFFLWSQGSFDRVYDEKLFFLICFVFLFSLVSIYLSRPLDALMFGIDYAKTLGINVLKIRNISLISVSLMVGVLTSLVGPIIFIGIVSPYIARMVVTSRKHIFLFPASFFIGALFALVPMIVVSCSGGMVLLNSVLSLFGAPVVLLMLYRYRKGNPQ